MHVPSTGNSFNESTAEEPPQCENRSCSSAEMTSSICSSTVQPQKDISVERNSLQCRNHQFPWCEMGVGPSAQNLLQRLRWTALGPHYNWSDRQYGSSDNFTRLPEQLVELGTRVAKMLQIPFAPDAALVNYYHKGDTLGGHKDDAENDMNQPIVSLSLGCSAIFLIGGDTKQVPPTPLLLQSGDVVVLSGLSRQYFHGMLSL